MDTAIDIDEDNDSENLKKSEWRQKDREKSQRSLFSFIIISKARSTATPSSLIKCVAGMCLKPLFSGLDDGHWWCRWRSIDKNWRQQLSSSS